MNLKLSITATLLLTMVAIILPIADVEIEMDGAMRGVLTALLAFVNVTDILVARYILMPSLTKQGVEQKIAELVGYPIVSTAGVMANVATLTTGIPELAIPFGFIGVYGALIINRYFENNPPASVIADASDSPQA